MAERIRSREEFRAEMKASRKRLLRREAAAHERCTSCHRELVGRESYKWRDGYRCAEDCHAAALQITAERHAARAQALERRRGAYTMTLAPEPGGYRIICVRNSSGEQVGEGAIYERLGHEGMEYDGRMGWRGQCALKELGHAEHSVMRVGAEVLHSETGWSPIAFEEWARSRKGVTEYSGFNAADREELERLLEEAG